MGCTTGMLSFERSGQAPELALGEGRVWTVVGIAHRPASATLDRVGEVVAGFGRR